MVCSQSSRLGRRLLGVGKNPHVALHERKIMVAPDFIANAGGVICASMEDRGGMRRSAFEYIDERIRENTRTVLQESFRGDPARGRRRQRGGAPHKGSDGDVAKALT